MSKVELQPNKPRSYIPPGWFQKDIRMALPFYKSRRGEYIHRVRSGRHHWRNGSLHHASFDLWCGQMGSVTHGVMYANIPENGVLCATCEGRAIGAGLCGARLINGNEVMFAPKS